MNGKRELIVDNRLTLKIYYHHERTDSTGKDTSMLVSRYWMSATRGEQDPSGCRRVLECVDMFYEPKPLVA